MLLKKILIPFPIISAYLTLPMRRKQDKKSFFYKLSQIDNTANDVD